MDTPDPADIPEDQRPRRLRAGNTRFSGRRQRRQRLAHGGGAGRSVRRDRCAATALARGGRARASRRLVGRYAQVVDLLVGGNPRSSEPSRGWPPAAATPSHRLQIGQRSGRLKSRRNRQRSQPFAIRSQLALAPRRLRVAAAERSLPPAATTTANRRAPRTSPVRGVAGRRLVNGGTGAPRHCVGRGAQSPQDRSGGRAVGRRLRFVVPCRGAGRARQRVGNSRGGRTGPRARRANCATWSPKGRSSPPRS